VRAVGNLTSPSMTLQEKILDPSVPVTFFEVVPPEEGKPSALDDAVEAVRVAASSVDAINLPEIHLETRPGSRQARFVPRLDPRRLAIRLQDELGAEVVTNHCVVYEPDPLPWFHETRDTFGIRNLVLVGGESSSIHYPGPSVLEAAELLRAAGHAGALGGISIPSRRTEAERIRRKKAAGLDFFTTQVLFDANDIVWLIQRLNGLEVRVFLSFAPVSHPGDLQFLRWLGADIPPDLDRFLLRDGASAADPGSSVAARQAAQAVCLERSLDLAQRILMEVFDNLPPDPPALGLNVEHINRRNFGPAVKMLERLGDLYASLVAAHARA
jgi:5,10-methylenetetrahydrofolate reductase